MEMTDRLEDILAATVEEFIRTGEPVSSAVLYKRHDFGIRPAMIRCELEVLADGGFLEQPHHAAGRIPSDKGYAFFANTLMNGGIHPSEEFAIPERFFARRKWEDFLGEISDTLGLLCVLHEHDRVHKNGIENLVHKLEWETQEDIRSVIQDFVDIDSRLEDARGMLEHTPEVFIGESPFTKSKSLAIIGGMYGAGEDTVTVLAIGPKRMDYKKTLNIFKSLKRKTSKTKTNHESNSNKKRE